jgi:hypothetical protein
MAASFGLIRTPATRKSRSHDYRAPVRDPLAGHLFTLDNAAFLFIDHPPAQLATIRSMGHELLLKNAVSTLKTFGVPVVHSTVNVRGLVGQMRGGTPVHGE